MTEDQTLKPCPFCGSEAEVYRSGTQRYSCIVGCTNCGCRLESNEIGSGEQWNQRFTDAACCQLPKINLSTAVMEIHAIENECALLIAAASNAAAMCPDSPPHHKNVTMAYNKGKADALQQIVISCKKAIAAIQPPVV